MRVDHTSIWVADLERAESAYKSVLDLRETWRNVYEDGTIEAFVRGSDGQSLQLMYRDGDEVDAEPDNFRYITVEVDDISDTLERTAEQDACEVIEEFDESAIISDPDGYRFKITTNGN